MSLVWSGRRNRTTGRVAGPREGRGVWRCIQQGPRPVLQGGAVSIATPSIPRPRTKPHLQDTLHIFFMKSLYTTQWTWPSNQPQMACARLRCVTLEAKPEKPSGRSLYIQLCLAAQPSALKGRRGRRKTPASRLNTRVRQRVFLVFL